MISAPARCLTLVCLTLLVGCALPPLRGRSPSYALTHTVDTRLGQAVAPRVADHPSQSGIHALRTGRDAFAARLLLAGAAQRSIDAQYYIWHHDTTGILLFEAIWQAADRGVRVRLLLDDHSTEDLDPRSPHSQRIKISKCACLTRCAIAVRAGSTTSLISGGLTIACTTNLSRSTTR